MLSFTSKRLFALIVGGLLVTGITAEASSPDAWRQHSQEVTNRCIKVSGLRNAQPAGQIVSFGDNAGYDALLVRGNYPQPTMNNQVGQFLCLFDRRTRQAYTSEANNLQSPGNQALGVPGQPIEQVLQWANSHRFLPPLRPVEKLDAGYPDYQSVITLGQRSNKSASYIAFEVFTDPNRIVTSQTIDYRDYSQLRRPLAFTRRDAEGLQLIQTIYGEQIKEDFRRSRHVRNEGTGNMTVKVYRGDLFVYRTWTDNPATQFSIYRLDDVNRVTQR
ncbi:MAG: hypothetical protein HC780_09870 [Leptolyngbyaceae cyanobacterium CSU_1_3]|nr:hypothetical protein [Leptolyngbyaceae cyanobacterium CSU_1_3]